MEIYREDIFSWNGVKFDDGELTMWMPVDYIREYLGTGETMKHPSNGTIGDPQDKRHMLPLWWKLVFT